MRKHFTNHIFDEISDNNEVKKLLYFRWSLEFSLKKIVYIFIPTFLAVH